MSERQMMRTVVLVATAIAVAQRGLRRRPSPPAGLPLSASTRSAALPA